MNKQYFEGKSNETCKAIVENMVNDKVCTMTDWDEVRKEPCFYVTAGNNDKIALTIREARLLREQLDIALSPFADFIAGNAAE